MTKGNYWAAFHRLWNNTFFVLSGGSFMVTFWTLLRFFDRPSTFDLVGQQVMAHQWLSNIHAHGAVVGPTNYLFKMLLFYVPLDTIPLSARFKLIFFTVILNIACFIAIFFVLRAIVELYHGRQKAQAISIPVLWFASISGSVYWIQFSNSRNVEVVLALIFTYVSLRLLLLGNNLRRMAIIIFLGGLLFFADPLQLYMTLLPLCTYGLVRVIFTSKRASPTKRLLFLVVAAVLAYGLAAMLHATSKHILGVEYLRSPLDLSAIAANIIHGTLPGITQSAYLYGGTAELGLPLRLINLLLACLGAVLPIWLFITNKERRLSIVVFVFLVVNLLVYIVSGQSLQQGTSRYLIMTAPMIVIALSLLNTAMKKYLFVTIAIIVLLNTVVLATIVLKQSLTNVGVDNHSTVAIQYVHEHDYKIAYTSMMLGIPADYYSQFSAHFLPIGCAANHKLVPTSLFFYKSSYEQQAAQHASVVPLILDGTVIQGDAATCSLQDITQQLGNPIRNDVTKDRSVVLLYPSEKINNALDVKHWAKTKYMAQ